MQQVCRRGEKVALYCLLGNIALALLKALAGLYGGSKAMLADAFNSAADSLTTLAVYAALKLPGSRRISATTTGTERLSPWWRPWWAPVSCSPRP